MEKKLQQKPTFHKVKKQLVEGNGNKKLRPPRQTRAGTNNLCLEAARFLEP